jgi:hypothetical protein
LTASTSIEGWKGLVIHARTPAALPSAFLASCDSVVNMMMGVNLCTGLAFIARAKLRPSMRGMLTSHTIRLGLCTASFSLASWPSMASSTA